MLELADSMERGKFQQFLSNIRGIIYRNGDEFVFTPPRETIGDLDILPFPAWDLFPFPSQKNSYPVYALGVPFQMQILPARTRK